MNNSTPHTDIWLRRLGLILLIALGVLSTLASGGGGGGSGGGSTTGTLQLEAASFDASEGTILNMAVNRSGGSSGVASVDYAITDGTAVAGSDYSGAGGGLSGTITFNDQQSGTKTIGIAIIDDESVEGPESFTVTLSNASGATLGANSSATVNIIDNESAPLSAFGVITELNSATINAIRYDTNGTSVIVNGQPANVADLKPGQVVAVQGDVNFSTAMGTADHVEYWAMVVGPVENIDAALDQLLVMGQTVLTNADTEFDPSIDPDTFAGLTLGTTVQISGFLNDAGDILATRIEPDTTSTGVQIVGTIAGLDLANMLFDITRLTVDYGSATIIDLPTGMPDNGLLVILRGTLVNGILDANEIVGITSPAVTPGERVNIGGIITRFVSPTDFDLNGFPVTVDTSTRFVNGAMGDLQTNAEIAIDGAVGTVGGTVLAKTITFGRPVSDRVTSTFDFENFTKISVLGLARVTVEQGLDFSIEVNANTDIIGDVQVMQTGDTVSFAPASGSGTRLFIVNATMPELTQIDIVPDSLANVTLKNFSQAQMTVNVGGVSILRGDKLMIDDLTSTVSGVSVLDLGDIRPIGNASIAISGVSRATLNMDIGSTVTGSVMTGQGTGTSALLYYGTNADVNVSTDALSSVIKLGETRP